MVPTAPGIPSLDANGHQSVALSHGGERPRWRGPGPNQAGRYTRRRREAGRNRSIRSSEPGKLSGACRGDLPGPLQARRVWPWEGAASPHVLHPHRPGPRSRQRMLISGETAQARAGPLTDPGSRLELPGRVGCTVSPGVTHAGTTLDSSSGPLRITKLTEVVSEGTTACAHRVAITSSDRPNSPELAHPPQRDLLGTWH
jgi:hypothetical protein